MNQFEANIIKSFRRAKKDIEELRTQISEIRNRLDGVSEEIHDEIFDHTGTQEIKTAVKHKTKHFVASKTGSKFHIPECPFAKNIKPKSKLVFKSKNVALNKGYKPCDCVK